MLSIVSFTTSSTWENRETQEMKEIDLAVTVDVISETMRETERNVLP